MLRLFLLRFFLFETPVAAQGLEPAELRRLHDLLRVEDREREQEMARRCPWDQVLEELDTKGWTSWLVECLEIGRRSSLPLPPAVQEDLPDHLVQLEPPPTAGEPVDRLRFRQGVADALALLGDPRALPLLEALAAENPDALD